MIRVAEAIVRERHGEGNAKVLIPQEEPPPRNGSFVQRHPPRQEWKDALGDARVFLAALEAAMKE